MSKKDILYNPFTNTMDEEVGFIHFFNFSDAELKLLSLLSYTENNKNRILQFIDFIQRDQGKKGRNITFNEAKLFYARSIKLTKKIINENIEFINFKSYEDSINTMNEFSDFLLIGRRIINGIMNTKQSEEK